MRFELLIFAICKWRSVRLAGLVILPLACLVLSPIVHASCRLEKIAEFHVDLVANSPIIDGQVNGQPIRILLETGSPLSFITLTAARQLHLPIRSYEDRSIIGVDGYERLETAVVKEFKIGELAIKNYTANVADTEINDANGVTAFQLGADLLSSFTTEWDLAGGVVRFLHPEDCKLEQLAYWSPSYFQVNLEHLTIGNPSLVLEVKINGKSTRARLVSGSAISYISPDAARNAGVVLGGPNAPPAGEITELAPKPISWWIGSFDTFEVGGETIRNARLMIGEVFPARKLLGRRWANSLPVRDPPEIALGADFLRANHLIIVPEKHVALFTYNGGAVFQVKRPAPQTSP